MQPLDDQPTAFTAPDLRPYNGEPCFVVGCGTKPMMHPHEPHQVPLGNNINMDISIDVAYTMDIEKDMAPHRIGSFWIADHTEDLPSGKFRYVFFENLPKGPFETRAWCLTVARTAHRLLEVGGEAIVRTGFEALKPGGLLHHAFRDVFGVVDYYQAPASGAVMHLRAVRTKQTD